MTSAAQAQAERNKAFVIRHFDELVNQRDLGAVDRNFTDGFIDHDGPDGRTVDKDQDRAFMAELQARLPDMQVEVRSAVADGDRVMVRNVWTGTDPRSGTRREFHGFVEWRFEDGRIAERWATVTAPAPLEADRLLW